MTEELNDVEEAWERVWLKDPDAFKPGTFMPNFHIPEEGVEHLAAYLHTLQGEANDAGRQWEYRISFMINTNDVFRGEMVWKRTACARRSLVRACPRICAEGGQNVLPRAWSG